MKRKIVEDLLKKADLAIETIVDGDEIVVNGYNDELQFEMYVVFKEKENGIEISSPLTPEFDELSENVLSKVDEFYEENQSMVDLFVDGCLYTILESDDATKDDIPFLLAKYLEFFADDYYIDKVNEIINLIMEEVL